MGVRGSRRMNHRPARCCALLALLALLALGGCTALSSSITQTAGLAIRQHRDRMPDAAQVAANPYSQMFVRTGSGQGVLVLGNLDGDREAWYGKGEVVLFLRHGRVVRTADLADNLEGLHAPADNPFARGLQHLATPVEYAFHMDWSGYRYGVPVHARLTPLGTTTLSILGARHEVLQVEATLDAPAAHWHAVDRYWVDVRDGLVWKSEQHVTPNQSLTLLQLKPYPGDRR